MIPAAPNTARKPSSTNNAGTDRGRIPRAERDEHEPGDIARWRGQLQDGTADPRVYLLQGEALPDGVVELRRDELIDLLRRRLVAKSPKNGRAVEGANAVAAALQLVLELQSCTYRKTPDTREWFAVIGGGCRKARRDQRRYRPRVSAAAVEHRHLARTRERDEARREKLAAPVAKGNTWDGGMRAIKNGNACGVVRRMEGGEIELTGVVGARGSVRVVRDGHYLRVDNYLVSHAWMAATRVLVAAVPRAIDPERQRPRKRRARPRKGRAVDESGARSRTKRRPVPNDAAPGPESAAPGTETKPILQTDVPVCTSDSTIVPSEVHPPLASLAGGSWLGTGSEGVATPGADQVDDTHHDVVRTAEIDPAPPRQVTMRPTAAEAQGPRVIDKRAAADVESAESVAPARSVIRKGLGWSVTKLERLQHELPAVDVEARLGSGDPWGDPIAALNDQAHALVARLQALGHVKASARGRSGMTPPHVSITISLSANADVASTIDAAAVILEDWSRATYSGDHHAARCA